MEFLATLERDGDGWMVTFASVPEAIAGGPTREEALSAAAEVLELALLTYAKDGRAFPKADGPSAIGINNVLVNVPASVVAKLAFIEAFQASGLSRVALARKLDKDESEIRRMLDHYHATKLPALEDGLRALGRRLVLSVEEFA